MWRNIKQLLQNKVKTILHCTTLSDGKAALLSWINRLADSDLCPLCVAISSLWVLGHSAGSVSQETLLIWHRPITSPLLCWKRSALLLLSEFDSSIVTTFTGYVRLENTTWYSPVIIQYHPVYKTENGFTSRVRHCTVHMVFALAVYTCKGFESYLDWISFIWE